MHRYCGYGRRSLRALMGAGVASVLATVLATVLSACGGGDSPAVPAGPSLSGTAATGAAIVGGTVSLKCVAGTGTSAVTGTDGNFSVSLSGVTLPCLVRVAYTDANGVAQKLHSLATAAGNVNITPVTELMVANLTGGAPTAAFDTFNAAKTGAITAAQVTAAATTVKSYLKNTLGMDVANLPDDPVGTKLVPKVGGVGGDAFDKVLDDLKAKLATSGKKLGDIAGDLAKSGGGGSSGAGTLVVTNATNPARNGTYAPDTALGSPSGSDSNITGNTKDGKFELNIRLASNGALKGAAFWYFDANNVITFFSCNTTTIPCPSTISYEPLGKLILLSKAELSQTNGPFDSSPEALVSGGGKITLDGSLSANGFVLGK